MARKPRFSLPGYPQHVIQRGHDRHACFFAPGDYRRYPECLAEAAAKYTCAVHAYVLMTNHVHLLLTPETPYAVQHLMQRLGQRYVGYVNHVYRRTGTLWEGRYKASLVENDRYLLACMRYIELNPVRAGMVAQPADYPWSSYRCNAQGRAEPLIRHHPTYAALAPDAGRRCAIYRTLFEITPHTDALDDIRTSLNRELVFGSDHFKQQIEAMTRRQTRERRQGRPREVRNDAGGRGEKKNVEY